MSNPDRFERFLGAALLAGGALVFALCGLCTLSFVGSSVLSSFRYRGGAEGLAGGLLLYGLIGGVPTAGGLVLMRYGWRMYRGPPRPTQDVTKAVDE